MRCYEDEEIGLVSVIPYNCDYINDEYQTVGENRTDYMEVFPNPTEGIVCINIPSKVEFVVKLYDSKGRVIREKELNINNQHSRVVISLNGIPRGVYFLIVTDSNGNKCVRKIVKQ